MSTLEDAQNALSKEREEFEAAQVDFEKAKANVKPVVVKAASIKKAAVK